MSRDYFNCKDKPVEEFLEHMYKKLHLENIDGIGALIIEYRSLVSQGHTVEPKNLYEAMTLAQMIYYGW